MATAPFIEELVLYGAHNTLSACPALCKGRMFLFDDVCLGRKDPGSQLRATTMDLTRHTYLPTRRRNA